MLDTHRTLDLLKEHKIEIVLLLLLGGLLFYIYSRFPEDPIAPSLGESRYLLKLDEVEIEDYWQNLKRWKLLGKQASVAKDNQIVFLTDVQIFVYNSQNPESTTIDIMVTANEGSIDWEKEVVTLTSDVEITRQSDMRINTEEAIYQYNEGLVHLPRKVDVRYLEETVRGEQLTYNIHQNRIELYNSILLE